MKINVRADHVEVEGYVNAIERNSKPLWSRIGKFIERICKGAFTKALHRNDDVQLLLNHNWDHVLGSTKQGNLELREDSIGLHARAKITDPAVIKKARAGELTGWSFGFSDREVAADIEHGIPTRAVKDLDLYEVSILDNTKRPAYEGTLITARSEETEQPQFYGVPFFDTPVIRQENTQSTEPPKQQPTPDVPAGAKKIDYSKYEKLIKELKGVN